jgi:hypothetical protein
MYGFIYTLYKGIIYLVSFNPTDTFEKIKNSFVMMDFNYLFIYVYYLINWHPTIYDFFNYIKK